MIPNSEEAFQRTAELFVERGFARSCVYDSNSRVVTVDWLPDGRHLQRLLRLLYGVPDRSMSDFTPTVLALPVFVVLFMTPPPVEPNV
jgi:hypothetical protein